MPQLLETCTSSGVNHLGPWLPRAELVCDGGEPAPLLPWQRHGMPAASRVTGEDIFYLFSVASKSVSTHHPTDSPMVTHAHPAPVSHTHTVQVRAGTDSHTLQAACMLLPLFYCLLKAVKLKGREKESIDRGVAISSEYLKSLAFSFFQQISVGLLHTYFCSLWGESRTTASSVTHTNTGKQT